MSEITILQEMKAWHGGEEAPADYAVGEAVLGRDGNLYGRHPKAYLMWDHGRSGAIDIIAYTPTPSPDTERLGGVGV